jgi:hypothetical protein
MQEPKLTPDQIRLRIEQARALEPELACWLILDLLEEVLPQLVRDERRDEGRGLRVEGRGMNAGTIESAIARLREQEARACFPESREACRLAIAMIEDDPAVFLDLGHRLIRATRECGRDGD